MQDQHLRCGDSLLCVLAIDNLNLFNQVESYIMKARFTYDDYNITMIMVGNKIDLSSNRRVVDTKVAKSYTIKNNMTIETMEKTRQGIECAFYELVWEIQNKKDNANTQKEIEVPMLLALHF